MRDIARLLRVPQVWVIVIGVMFTPALYSWFNVAAFWDPYGNVQNIRVAVVNEDRGDSSDLTGPLDVGGQLVDRLKENQQLGWTFMDADQADEAVRKGDVYASITVPPTFTGDILGIFEGSYTQPELIYRVNEKDSAISPKITDKGATSLDTVINSVVKEKVADAVTKELKKQGGRLEDRLGSAQNNAVNAFDETSRTLDNASNELATTQQRITDADPSITAAQDTLRSVDTSLGTAQQSLSQVQSIMTDVQGQITTFATETSGAFVDGTGALAEGTSSANAAVATVTGELERANSTVGTARRDASDALRQGEQTVNQLQGLLGGAALAPGVAQPLQDALNGLQSRNAQNRDILNDLDALQNNTSQSLNDLAGAGDALEQATGQANNSAQALHKATSETLPKVQAAINRLNNTAGNFSGAIGATRTQIGSSIELLDGVRAQLKKTNEVLDNFENELRGTADGLNTARLDVAALKFADDGSLLDTVTELDSVGISRFLATPAEVTSHEVYPVSSYGSGMAALFTNLSLWIGAFMLMIIFRTEVDKEGLKKLSVGQAFRGRLALLTVFALGQAIIVSIGNLIIGVQTVNPVVFIATSAFIGVCYLTIVYSLIATWGHLGRGIVVVLAFLQVSGASGLYPIEMTPDFFQLIHPLLPITYGVDALRETIGGFYGNFYVRSLGILALMAFVAYLVGVLLKRGLANVMRLVNDQLEKGGLIVSDRVEVVGHGYRLRDVLFAVRDQDAFRYSIDERWKTMRTNYSFLLRLTAVAGIAGAVLIAGLAQLLEDQSTLLFGVLCLWLLAVVTFVAGLEYVKQSYLHAHTLSELSSSELREELSSRVPAGASPHKPSDPESNVDSKTDSQGDPS